MLTYVLGIVFRSGHSCVLLVSFGFAELVARQLGKIREVFPNWGSQSWFHRCELAVGRTWRGGGNCWSGIAVWLLNTSSESIFAVAFALLAFLASRSVFGGFARDLDGLGIGESCERGERVVLVLS
jgi:hypothetical protein